jgi:hypothetical protein
MLETAGRALTAPSRLDAIDRFRVSASCSWCWPTTGGRESGAGLAEACARRGLHRHRPDRAALCVRHWPDLWPLVSAQAGAGWGASRLSLFALPSFSGWYVDAGWYLDAPLWLVLSQAAAIVLVLTWIAWWLDNRSCVRPRQSGSGRGDEAGPAHPAPPSWQAARAVMRYIPRASVPERSSAASASMSGVASRSCTTIGTWRRTTA